MRRIAIVGAGLGGLCAAIQARAAGHDVTVFEQADEVGGTWRANRYPGVACDVPALLYQFSFAPNPDWSHFYARGREIHAYTKSLVGRFGLAESLRLGEGVRRAAWIAARQQWAVTSTAGNTAYFDCLVPALGQLNRPAIPDLPGLNSFRGRSWHSARWPAEAALAGLRVGVVGSAASAVQLIPEIAQEAERLVVFQRTANWCLPRGDVEFPAEVKALLATDPETAMALGASRRQYIFDEADHFFWQAFQWTPAGRAAYTRTALDHLHAQVPDADLRARLTPDYPIGCKRVLITDDFYPALMRDNVVLETSHIDAVEPGGIRTRSAFHDLDVIVFATGFDATGWNWSMDVIGSDGVPLHEVWRDDPEAYLGIMVAGFPNMFMLYGPNTNLGHNSISFMLESQTQYFVRVLRELEKQGLAVADVTADGQRQFNARLQAELAQTAWADPGCQSWYKTSSGRISQNWSGNCTRYAAETAQVDRAAVALS